METNKKWLLDETGQPKVFYHGTHSEKARYYGPNIIKVNLSMRKPFYFTEELQTMEGQETSVIGDMGAFAIFAV